MDSTNNRVGIGTTSPNEKLEINGRLRINGNQASPGIWFYGNNFQSDTNNVFFGRGGSSFDGIGFWFSNWQHVFLNNGNVGIGDTSPSYRLDVNGSGRFTGDLTAGANLTVTGDLTVSGTTTTVETTNMVVEDSLIELNTGASSNTNDCGIVIERGSTGDNAFMGWDESADKFLMGTTTATGASTCLLYTSDAADE